MKWTFAPCLLLAACGGGGQPQPGGAIPPPHTEAVISYGQSLSLGARATVNYPSDLSIPPDTENVGMMFVGGTRPDDLSSLAPFAESTQPVSLEEWNIDTPGETPLYGALTQLQSPQVTFIGSAAGRGGATIAELSRGSRPYDRLLAQVRAGQSLTQNYSVRAIIWMQGEADAGNANYVSEFEQLVMDLDADIRALTHQGPVQVHVCLPGPRDIARAQQSVADAVAQVHIACDSAALAHDPDATHLTAASSREAGVMLGESIQKW
jgi:Carbohydrate esterase, sialic acid-specific acetylesterase